MNICRVIVPDEENSSALAKLHLESFPGFFLSTLGLSFLRLLYKSYVDDPSCACFASYQQTSAGVEVVGSLVLISNPSLFYKTTFMRKWHKFAFYAAPSLIRNTLVVAKKLLSAVFYRGDADDCQDFVNAGLISSICVSPKMQGQGVGRDLLKLGETWAFSNKLEKIFLLTDRDNNEAVNRFYLSNGYLLHSIVERSGGRVMNRYYKILQG